MKVSDIGCPEIGRRVSRWPLGTLLCVAGVLISCHQQPSASSRAIPADAVALVGDTALLQSDLDHAQTLAGARPPASVLDDLVSSEALARLARAEGIDQEPSVRAAIRRLLVTRLQEKHLAPAEVTAAEITSALQKEPSPVARPAASRIAFLRKRFANSTEQTAAVASLEEARAVYQSLAADPNRSGFGPLAVTFSDDNDTRHQGGDAGWITAGNSHLLVPAEVVSAAAALSSPGLVPAIIQSSGAAWLVLVIEVKASAAAPVDSPQIRTRLLAGKEAEARANLTTRAMTASPATLLVKPAAPSLSATPAPPANP
jgi:hypothetical protein